MAVESGIELVEALAAAEFDRIVGTPESQEIDFKARVYDLNNRRSGRDLAADVAAFANAGGGYIVMGAKTELTASEHLERVVQLPGVAKAAIDRDAYTKFIRAHVYPLVRRVDVRFYPGVGGDPDLFIALLVVPPQADHDQPFVVDLVLDTDDNTRLKHGVGWPVREGDDTHWEAAARIQQLLSVARRLTPPDSTAPLDDAPDGEDDLVALKAILDEESEWRKFSRIIVQVLPRGGRRIHDFYGSFQKGALEWDGLRGASGFGLDLPNNGLKVMHGRLVSAFLRPASQISRSGVVTVAASGSPSFLGWAQSPPGSTPVAIKINPYPLVEFPLEALRFAYLYVGPEIDARGWELRLIADRLNGDHPLIFRRDPWDADRSVTDSVNVLISGTGIPEADAFTVVAEFLGHAYGLGHASVPFAQDDRIRPEMLARQN